MWWAQEAVSDLVTPWLVFFAVACVLSIVAIGMKLQVFVEQMKYAASPREHGDCSSFSNLRFGSLRLTSLSMI